MTRIAGTSLDEIQFRQVDTPPTRAQKLELIREAVIALQNEGDETSILEGGNVIDSSPYPAICRIPGYFVATPGASATLHLHTFTSDMHFYRGFGSAEAAAEVLPTADFIATIYRNPVITAGAISGGQEVGTVTFYPTGEAWWQTADGRPVQFNEGDVIGIRAPAIADATIEHGSFTLVAWLGFAANLEATTDADDVEASQILLSGDMQDDGDDGIWLSGDEEFTEPVTADFVELDA